MLTHRVKVGRQSLVVGVVFMSFALALGQTSPSPAPNKPGDRQLNMLVLGDSILWGEGLKTEHKAWYQVKTWLAARTGREVIAKIQAHAGAVIEAGVTESITPVDGEVNFALPAVSDQVDRALRSYADPSQVDLVLVNGCANDIGTHNFLNAGITAAEIRRLTETKCRAPVERLLRKITSSFANAHVIITGYYPFFSEKTRNDFVMRAMARSYFKANSGAPELKSKEALERLTANSKEWYESSNRSIAEAVAKVNAEPGAGGSRRRVLFAEIHFLPEHSFGAKETRLWGLSASPFRKLLVLLSLGKIKLPTNDERRRQRNARCDEFYRQPVNETGEQKQYRNSRRLSCRYAALGHPNREGAALYAEAVTNQLKAAISDAGWPRELGGAPVPHQ